MSRRSIVEIDSHREALSLRGIERVYGFAREYVSGLARSGELPAMRHGNALRILRADFEAWMRQRAISNAERRVAELLERERRPRGRV
jgi:excisionase family DNA binding protein